VHDEGYGRALVLEDDVVYNPRATASQLLQAMREMPADAEMAYLGYCFSRTHELVTSLWRHGAACCTHAYVVSHFGAAKLLQLLQPLSAPIDEVMRDLCYSGQINCYVVDLGPGVNSHPGYLHEGLFLQTVSKGT
jgi:GR25 family glycosyltransferase involved in LPS biosynthesis